MVQENILPTEFMDYINELSTQDIRYNTICAYLDAFVTYLDYCNASPEIKMVRAFYRASFKKKFRSGALDKAYRSGLDNLLSQLHPHPTPCKPRPDEEYLQESLEIFRMRYIQRVPISKIMTSHDYVLAESDIHRRLDYITELIIISILGLEYLVPGLDIFFTEFELLTGISFSHT